MTAGVLLAIAVPAYAADKKDKQETTTRTVQGTVTDTAEAPLEGAVVQLKDTKSLQIRSYITKSGGQYQFYGLSPDVDYELKADHQGASSSLRRLSSFDSRKQAVVNLKVEKK
jgi:C-terminal processing protease CtpA/Prc